MKKDRMAKVNRLLQTVLADLIPHQLKDPRVHRPDLVSVSEVRTTPDLRMAKVFIAIMGTDLEKKDALNCIIKARGYLRTEIGHMVRLRHIPELCFILDRSGDEAQRIGNILNEISLEKTDPLLSPSAKKGNMDTR